jgi:hypothetical protein
MLPFLSSDQPENYPDRFRGLLPVASLAGSLALFAWHWALALSLVLGAIVTLLLYRLQLAPWQTWLRSGQNYLHTLSNSPQRVLMVALLGGSLTLGGTYLTTAIWKELHSLWITTGFALEGVGLLILLGLGVLQGGLVSTSYPDDPLDQILSALRHSDPLQRLQGIYRADRLGQRSELTPDQIHLLVSGLTLLAQQEAIGEVRNTALDTLDRFYEEYGN